MRGEIKKRLALLSILLVAGLAMAGVATTLGASDTLKFTESEVSVLLAPKDGKITIKVDGKVVKETILPYDISKYKCAWEISGNEIRVVVHAPAEFENKVSKWLEIANKDSRIQKLTDGEGIQSEDVDTIMFSNNEVILTVNINGKYYKITIDLNSETVKSIEELQISYVRPSSEVSRDENEDEG